MAGWQEDVSIPTTDGACDGRHRQVPAACHPHGLRGAGCLGERGRSPQQRWLKLHKMPCWCSGLWEPHLIVLARCHLQLVSELWPLVWSSVALHLHCSAFTEEIIWAKFGLCFLPWVGIKWFYRQHQYPADVLVLHPQVTFNAYCPLSSGLKPTASFHPWGSQAISKHWHSQDWRYCWHNTSIITVSIINKDYWIDFSFFFFFFLQMFKKPQTCIRVHNLVEFPIAGGILLSWSSASPGRRRILRAVGVDHGYGVAKP